MTDLNYKKWLLRTLNDPLTKYAQTNSYLVDAEAIDYIPGYYPGIMFELTGVGPNGDIKKATIVLDWYPNDPIHIAARKLGHDLKKRVRLLAEEGVFASVKGTVSADGC